MCDIVSLSNIGAGNWRKQCFSPITMFVCTWTLENADQTHEVLICFIYFIFFLIQGYDLAAELGTSKLKGFVLCYFFSR